MGSLHFRRTRTGVLERLVMIHRWRAEGIVQTSVQTHTFQTRIRGLHVRAGVQRRVAGHGGKRDHTEHADHRRL